MHICFSCLNEQLHSHLLWCVTHVYSASFITLNITAGFVFYFHSSISPCCFSLSSDLYFHLSFVIYCLWSRPDHLQWCDLIVQTKLSSHSWNLEQCVTLCILKRWFSSIHKDIHLVFEAHYASSIQQQNLRHHIAWNTLVHWILKHKSQMAQLITLKTVQLQLSVSIINSWILIRGQQ